VRIRSANPGHPSANHCANRYTFAPHTIDLPSKLLPHSPIFPFRFCDIKSLLPSSYRLRSSKQHEKTRKHDSIGSEKASTPINHPPNAGEFRTKFH
jgi:hypothetical protein